MSYTKDTCGQCKNFLSDYAKSEWGICQHPWNLKRRVKVQNTPDWVGCVSYEKCEIKEAVTALGREENFEDYISRP